MFWFYRQKDMEPSSATVVSRRLSLEKLSFLCFWIVWCFPLWACLISIETKNKVLKISAELCAAG